MEKVFHPVADIFPLMDGPEYAALVADIAEHGQREAIWLHPDGSIIDGRNRYRACMDLGIAPEYRTWDGDGSLVSLVVSLNLQRRHLTSGQRAVVALDMLPLLEEEARKRMTVGVNQYSSPDQFFDQGSLTGKRAPQAAAQAAALVGTNRQYVADAKKLVTDAPDLLALVRAGPMTIPQAKREVKKRQRESALQVVLAKYDDVPVFDGGIETNTISQANIFDLKLPENSIDMVFTDPPYHDEYVDLYGALAEVSAHCLKPGGYLMAYIGKMFLPDVIERMAEHLEYVSIFAVFQPFSQARIMKHNLFENWRPILVFKKPGKTGTREWVQDVVRGTRDKSHHDWQQDEEAPLQYIAAYTKPGDIVLDPFVGGGTTPAVCKAIGRYFVCFDASAEAVKISMERVNNG